MFIHWRMIGTWILFSTLTLSVTACGKKSNSTRSSAIELTSNEIALNLVQQSLSKYEIPAEDIAKVKTYVEKNLPGGELSSLHMIEIGWGKAIYEYSETLRKANKAFGIAIRHLGVDIDKLTDILAFWCANIKKLKDAKDPGGSSLMTDAELQQIAFGKAIVIASMGLDKLTEPDFDFSDADKTGELNASQVYEFASKMFDLLSFQALGGLSRDDIKRMMNRFVDEAAKAAVDESMEDITPVKEGMKQYANEANEGANSEDQIDVAAIESDFNEAQQTIDDHNASLAPTLTFSTTELSEANSNDGSISASITATLTKDTFAIASGALTANTHFSLSGTAVPTGLTAAVTVTSSTQAVISFSGNASSHDFNDSVTGIVVTFHNAAFTKGQAPLDQTDEVSLDLNFFDDVMLNYFSTSFDEDSANDGSITDTITVTSSGDNFAMADGVLTLDTHYSLSGTAVPAGLTLVVTKTAPNIVEVSLTGNAASHLSANSVTGIGITFLDAAFTRGAAPNDGTESNSFDINFSNAISLSYSGTSFTEAVADDGSITATITVTANDGSFFQSSGTLTPNTHYTIDTGSAVPTGLTAVVTLNSATEAVVSFSGNASSHLIADSVSNIVLVFLDAAFSGNAAPTDGSEDENLSITFTQPSTLIPSVDEVFESSSNNGTLTTSFYVNVTGDTFVDAGPTLTENTHYVLSGTAIPSGLTLTVYRFPGYAQLAFSGSASAHASTDSITGVIITFLDAAFTSGSAPADGSDEISFDITFVDTTTIIMYSAGPGDGNLGGRSGADSACAMAKPGSVSQSAVRAFITVDDTDEIQDMPFSYNVPTDAPIKSESGTTIADDWADLLDGSIDIDLTLGGVIQTSFFWWSGSDSSGAESGFSCSGWTTSSGAWSGTAGDSSLTNSNWISLGGLSCDSQEAELICIAFD